MDTMQRYRIWSKRAVEDDELIAELEGMKNDPKQIHECFYRTLAFGTAGLRGVLGAGDNRMNIYTVRRATQGLANYLLARHSSPSVAIAYDSRKNSRLFCEQAACVLAANNVKAYLYDTIMPTPMLSWAVRELSCQSGIVITASHNPKEYNGYKVYGEDGCQITEKAADDILYEIEAVDPFEDVVIVPLEDAFDCGMAEYIGQSVIERYEQKVLESALRKDIYNTSELRVVYTPLCGSGAKPVQRVLKAAGLRQLFVVAEQAEPDEHFTTCPYPNPEMPQAMQLGVEQAIALGADLLIGTDPDADRVGVFARHNGEMLRLSGNDVGVLLCEYICRTRAQQQTLPPRAVMVKSIVSTPLADAVCAHYGVEMRSVLTGFKYIAGEISVLEQEGRGDDFIFGFEESCGYLPVSFVRDKDAVAGALFVCEMAAYYKSLGKTLHDVLADIFARHGYYLEQVENIAFAGSDGMGQMQSLMDSLFANPFAALGGIPVAAWSDYRNGIRHVERERQPILLPKSDVAVFLLANGCTVVIRPSGTEPKLKLYYICKSETREDAKACYALLSTAVKTALGI